MINSTLLVYTLLLFSSVSTFKARILTIEDKIGISFSSRPDHANIATFARWLVHGQKRPFGVISTISLHLNGIVYGNVFDYSDGNIGSSTGRIVLYMDDLDATPQDLSVDNSASFTISEARLQPRCTADPEDPTCSKITLSGTVEKLSGTSEEDAKKMFFARHGQARFWKKDHGWNVYELHIESIFMLNYYGGAKNVSLSEYFTADCCSTVDSNLDNPTDSAYTSSIQQMPLQVRPLPLPALSAVFARWLVRCEGAARLPWGVLSTASSRPPNKGKPFGNVLSYADLPADGSECSGRVVFYMTALDASAQDVAVNPLATFTISEDQRSDRGCLFDPEDPNCAKIMLTGRMDQVPEGDALEAATNALFSRHLQMKSWPTDHNWLVYELKVANIFLLNHYGPGKDIDVNEYYSTKCPSTKHVFQPTQIE